MISHDRKFRVTGGKRYRSVPDSRDTGIGCRFCGLFRPAGHRRTGGFPCRCFDFDELACCAGSHWVLETEETNG